MRLLLALLMLVLPVLAHAGSSEDADAGRTAVQRRDWAAAIRLYSAALDRGDLPPETQATAHNNRGIAFARSNRNDEALADFDAAIRLNPRYQSVYVNRGDIYQFKGQYAKAIADYDMALQLRAGDEVAYYDRGNSYAALGKHREAIADYDAALRLKKDYQPAYFNRGNSYQAIGRFAEAVIDFDTAVKYKADDIDAIHSRGFVNFYLGRYAAAAEDFQRGAANDAYVALWRHLARSRIGQADPHELALNTVVKYDRDVWPGPIIALFLGQMEPAQVQAAAAKGDAKKRREQGCEASFYLAEHALLRVEIGDAQRLFREALDGCPSGFVEHIAAEAELKRLVK
ncbi:MAG TPA: tetratricopeptide repeat protein [Stellaceae bacterium]|nr:tetratricopeptide repeat protein [Stellaceae bacterium]